jgi:Transcriptional regulator
MVANIKNVDRRILRSKALLLNALLDLMKYRVYSNINIIDITEKANVARTTFYRNYKCVDDILIDEMDRRFDIYFNEVEKFYVEGNLYKSAESVFLTWEKYGDLYEAFQKAGLGYKMLVRFDEYTLRVLKKYIMKTEELTDDITYSAHFFAGGAYMVLDKWFQDEMKPSINELASKLEKNLLSLIESALRN